jgi:cytochrome b pre-mRNA-processing protein 3
MFSLFKRKASQAEQLYKQILEQARNPILYDTFNVPDTPIGRFQMIILHACPVMMGLSSQNKTTQTQMLFDTIFQDVEYSMREIGVGDLAVPKKMKRYMQDFNGILQAHSEKNADHANITRRNVFGEDGKISPPFKKYIKDLFQ